MARARFVHPKRLGRRPQLRRFAAEALCTRVLLVALLAPHSTGYPSEADAPAIATQTPIASFVYAVDHAPPDLSNWDYVGLWGDKSTVSLLATTGDPSQARWRCLADRKSDRVGKAYVTKNFPAVRPGDIVEAQARYLIHRAPLDSSLYLMDIECRDCGPRWKAGIRVLVRQGQLRVNRDKLGLKEDFISTDGLSVPIGTSFTLSARLRLGDESGKTIISIDGKPVIDRRGVNMPLRRIAALRDLELAREQLDYVQFGVTANSGSSEAEVSFSDVAIKVFKPERAPNE